MQTRKCEICGKLFLGTASQKYCKGPHYHPCPICGKPVKFESLSEAAKCCSKECAAKKREHAKRKERRCTECGKLFIAKQATQKFCAGPHYTKCVICGRQFEYSCRPTEKPKTCSKGCQEALRSQTALERYGVANVSELSEVQKKISEKNSSAAVQQQRKQTSLEHWGVDNPAKHVNVRRKMSEVMKSDEYLTKRAETCLRKYGAESPMQTAAVKARRAATCIERYGIIGHPITATTYAKKMIDGSKVDNYLEFKTDPKSYIAHNYQDKPSIFQLEQDLGVTNTPIYDILVDNNCRDLISHSYSNMEQEVVKFIQSIKPGINIIQNDRTIIKPQELDIYIPEYALGIECNPTATHNSSFLDPWGGAPKHYKYHQTKSREAIKNGIRLFHIFGYEWKLRRPIIQSMLVNLLGETSSKINGRDTQVVEIDNSRCQQFLAANHRQGSINAKVRLGLLHEDELVAVMTFNHIRSTMGSGNKRYDDTTWELSRFCNKLQCSVRGGASKLFKHFIKLYNPSSVISFSDVAHTDGKLYKILGFSSSANWSTPSYVWADIYDTTYYHRVSCQKRNLRKLFHDDAIDIEHHTEKEIMMEHGYAQVFDCGTIRWEYTR